MGIGEASSIGAALSWAGGVIVYKRLGETLPPLQLNLIKNLIVLGMIVPTLLLVQGFDMPDAGHAGYPDVSRHAMPMS